MICHGQCLFQQVGHRGLVDTGAISLTKMPPVLWFRVSVLEFRVF